MSIEELVMLIDEIDTTLAYVDPDNPAINAGALEVSDYINAIQAARELIRAAKPEGDR